MSHPESEHGLRVQLATALRERDEMRADRDYCAKQTDAANARADAATTKAEQYERDWYAAKNDFGNAMAKSREALAAARRECELLRDCLRECVKIVDAAGLLNLSNGVQLGQTSWYVKASDAFDAARAALATPGAATGEEKS